MTDSSLMIPTYLTLRLDVLSGVLMTLGDEAHQARDGISVREARLLLLVRQHPGVSMRRLVELAFMEKTMASKAVTALTQAGLLERHVGETDARQVSLRLTRKGAGVAERAHKFVIEATDGILAILEPQERKMFYDALGKLAGHALALYEEGGFDLLGRPRKLSTASVKPKAGGNTTTGGKPASRATGKPTPLPISSQAALKRQPPRARN